MTRQNKTWQDKEKTKQSKRTQDKTKQDKTRQGKTSPVLRYFCEGFALIYSRGGGSRRNERVRVRAKQGKIRQIKPR